MLTRQKIGRDGIDNGHVYYATRPTTPGDVELRGGNSSAYRPLPGEGRGTLENPTLSSQKIMPTERVFASPGFAKIYNNHYSRGFNDWNNPAAGTLYQKLQFAANASVGLKLSLSAYHAMNIVQETWTAGLGRVIGDVAHGEL